MYFSEAKARTYMNFPMLEGEKNQSLLPVIDAIYVPTRFKQKDRCTKFHNSLKRYAKHIFTISRADEACNAIGSAQILLKLGTHISEGFQLFHEEIVTCKSGTNPSREVVDDYDLPAKRNFAIEHARRQGYKEIMLLDDDIEIESSTFIRGIELLRNKSSLVGFYVLSHPDVSTVDHIQRHVKKKPSSVSVAGNCLMMRVTDICGFFPYIYNEDWLFIYAANYHLSTASAGYAKQLYYEPWTQPGRVSFEQFGDIIARGIKQNYLTQKFALSGNIDFWHDRWKEHSRVLRSLQKCSELPAEQKAAVEGALSEVKRFSSDELYSFVCAYRSELNEEGCADGNNISTRE